MTNNIYWTLYKDYADQIETGALQPGSKLPSENELAATYQITRETVRKGLNLLAQNGYIHKVKGKGSFVLDTGRMNFPVTGLVSYKEMAERIGRKSRTIVHETECVPAGEAIAKELHTRPDRLVWKVIRSREIEGERIILDVDYLLADIVTGLTREITGDSIYQYLEQELHLKISYSKKSSPWNELRRWTSPIWILEAIPMSSSSEVTSTWKIPRFSSTRNPDIDWINFSLWILQEGNPIMILETNRSEVSREFIAAFLLASHVAHS